MKQTKPVKSNTILTNLQIVSIIGSSLSLLCSVLTFIFKYYAWSILFIILNLSFLFIYWFNYRDYSMHTTKKLIFIMIILLIIECILSTQVLQLSYVEYISDCHPQYYQNSILSTLYTTNGYTSYNIDNFNINNRTTITDSNVSNYISTSQLSNITVVVLDNNTATYKHEHVHVIQLERGWPSLSCVHPFQVWLAELESQVAQNLPNSIYKCIYGNYYNN